MSSFPTLADLATVNDQNAEDVGITDLVQDAPLLAALAADTASNGTQHKYVKETTAPTIGFRAVNTGRAHSKSGNTLVTATLELLDASNTVDTAIASEYKEGAASYLLREANAHLREGFFHAEKQIIYGTGTGGDANGFVGLSEAYDEASDAQVTALDSGGTGLTSVWFLRSGGDMKDVTLILGNDGNIQIEDPVKQRVEDEATANTYYIAWITQIQAYMGLQLGSIWSARRLANVATGGTGDTLNDDRIYAEIAKFPANRKPNLIVMNQLAQEQLRNSRSATHPTGQPAPTPDTAGNGVPIIVTDALLSTEAPVV